MKSEDFFTLCLVLPLCDPNMHAARCWFVCWGLSYISSGTLVYVLEHSQPGFPLNHVVIFEDDILCKRGPLVGGHCFLFA